METKEICDLLSIVAMVVSEPYLTESEKEWIELALSKIKDADVKEHLCNILHKYMYPKYYCRFDDGEYISEFTSLEEAKKYRQEMNFRFISRYIYIEDVFGNRIVG